MDNPTFTNLSGVEIPEGTRIKTCGWPSECEQLVATDFRDGAKEVLAYPMASSEVAAILAAR